MLDGSGDIGTWVHTDLSKTPTEGPYNQWSSGSSIDTARSDSRYIAGVGVINSAGSAAGTDRGAGQGEGRCALLGRRLCGPLDGSLGGGARLH
jgi:hypothetical protein